MSVPNLSALREAVRGEVLLPNDTGFEDARRPWNSAVDQPVVAVVTPEDADDVAAAVRVAKNFGLPIAVQPTGHGATGTAVGTILLRTGRLDEITVDPEARTARIGAGVKSGALTAAAAEHGLVHRPGSSPVVSATGYTLGGGVGFFARKYGMSSDHVIEFEVVDAEGELRRANAEENPDLFHALAGGGGDFAIVTATTLRLNQESDLFGGTVIWPADRGAEVFAAFRAVTAAAPPELTVWFSLAQFPGAPPMALVSVAHLGPEDEARELLKPFEAVGGVLNGAWAPLPFAEIGTITNDPVDPVPSVGRTEFLSRLDDDAVAMLLAEPLDPLLLIQVRHLGGALAQDRQGPYGPVTEEFAVFMTGSTPTPESAAAVAAKEAEITAKLGSAVTGRKTVSLLGPSDTPAGIFAEPELERLRAVKKTWDPEGRFVANYPIGA